MIKGIHHIAASVEDLDAVVAFYQGAIDLPVAGSFETADSAGADRVTGLKNVRSRAMFLSARTTYLELFQFASPKPAPQQIMPVQGPGITHVCFQSPKTDPAFEKFQAQGMTMVSRGDRPVPLSPLRDITYAYARDTAGNMFEMEQWGTPPRPFPAWIAHVAFVTPDIQRLLDFYGRIIMEIDELPGIINLKENANADIVADVDAADILGTWVPTPNILIEIWQYNNPPTPAVLAPASHETLGYTHICFEVEDVMGQYERLSSLGVAFISEPLETATSLLVFGRDPDGNLFELLQYLDPSHPMSLAQLDFGLG